MPAKKPIDLTPLAKEPRSHLPTSEAAMHLGREPDTLRSWAHSGTGPVAPTRVSGRLLWPVAQLRKVINGK